MGTNFSLSIDKKNERETSPLTSRNNSTQMALNRLYFDILEIKTKGNYDYQIVRPKGNPMILFSNIDGTPLASVQVKCQEGQSGKALTTRRLAGETNFQALIDRDHQEFEFVITNLTGEGMVKIDIMKNGDKIVDVDPGATKGGVNQVNELHEYQSIEIRCDQKDNLSFVLDAIKKSDGSGQMLTVRQAETDAKPKGTKYWISVVPQGDKPELIKKFVETFWACVDIFVIRKERPKEPFLLCSAPMSTDVIRKSAQRAPMDMRIACLMPTGISRGRDDDDDDDEEDKYVVSKGATTPSNWSLGRTTALVPQSPDMDFVVKQSFAAMVRGGRQLEVTSGFTGKSYVYDNHSVKCTLGLSVAEGLTFRDYPPRSELIQVGEMIIKHYTEETMHTYLEQLSKIYLSEDCVICMNGVPSSVFYSCGHQCCHHDCGEKLKQCPLCRTYITAMIKV